MKSYWLAAVAIIFAVAVAGADGPGDNLVDKVRPVPPPGIKLAAADQQELTRGIGPPRSDRAIVPPTSCAGDPPKRRARNEHARPRRRPRGCSADLAWRLRINPVMRSATGARKAKPVLREARDWDPR